MGPIFGDSARPYGPLSEKGPKLDFLLLLQLEQMVDGAQKARLRRPTEQAALYGGVEGAPRDRTTRSRLARLFGPRLAPFGASLPDAAFVQPDEPVLRLQLLEPVRHGKNPTRIEFLSGDELCELRVGHWVLGRLS